MFFAPPIKRGVFFLQALRVLKGLYAGAEFRAKRYICQNSGTMAINSQKLIAAVLKEKLKSAELDDEALRTRLHRAISWLGCAEMQQQEPDLHFLGLWISFNACYAIELTEADALPEREKFKRFISSLIRHDKDGRVFSLLWNTFQGSVRMLIDNPFVFRPFWNYQRGEAEEWEEAFAKSNTDALRCLSGNKVDELLHIILDRLYVLRNQVFHGGATFRSTVNRSQVKDGASILEKLVPEIILIIMEHPQEDWGRLMYPVVKPV